MEYILIDNFNDTLNIVCKDDGSGEPLILNTLLKAETAKEENCQNGQIIPLGIDLIKLISYCEDFISQILIEEGKENFDGIQPLCDELGEVLDLEP